MSGYLSDKSDRANAQMFRRRYPSLNMYPNPSPLVEEAGFRLGSSEIIRQIIIVQRFHYDNIIKAEIKELQNKAAEISEHFEN